MFAAATLVAAGVIAMMSIRDRTPGSVMAQAAGLAIMTATVISVVVLAILLHRTRRPMLLVYAALVTLAFAIELLNFGLPAASKLPALRPLFGWLQLVAIVIAVELAALAALRRLPRSLVTAVSATYHIMLGAMFIAIALYNLRFSRPISGHTVVALLQTTGFEMREFVALHVDALMAVVVAVFLGSIAALN